MDSLRRIVASIEARQQRDQQQKRQVASGTHVRRKDGKPGVWKRGKAARPACGARTRAGAACKAEAVEGGKRCRMHGGLSTGPRTPEGRAAIAESNRRRAAARRAAPE